MKRRSIIPCSLTKRRHDFDYFGDLIDSIFSDFLPANGETSSKCDFLPSINLEDNKDSLKITAELPGLSEKDIDVQVEDDRLVISGHKQEDYDKEEDGKKVIGRSYGSFCKAIPLHCSIDQDKVDACLKNGLLTITLPKLEECKTKKIELRAA